MDINDVFGGDSLKAEDLQGKEPIVVIADVDVKAFDNGKKLVIKFQRAKKCLICNKTNAERIAFIHGKNIEGWVGKEIQLYVDPFVQYAGKRVSAIRIKPAERRTVQTAAPAPAPMPAPVQQSTADALSDDIPF